MIAQLSHSEPRGRPSSSSSGVRCAGSFARNSGVVVAPQTSVSSNSSPAARTKTRAVRLFTLGLRMFSVMAAMRSSPSVLDELRLVLAALQGAVGHELDPGLHDERLADAVADRAGERVVRRPLASELDADRQRRLLLDA